MNTPVHGTTTRLRAHWDSFITRDDLAWFAGVGINAVRIPVGHWIFGPPYPYHAKYGGDPHPFVDGGIEVLDLHAAPGCRPGFSEAGTSAR